MAGDWIKMRISLRRDPCVSSIADFLAAEREFMDFVTDPVRQSCRESVYEHITSDITRAITVCALLEVWGVARDRGDRDGDDLVLKHCTLTTLDDISGVPCFGDAMDYVGWASEEEINDAKGRTVYRVRFPKFFKDQEAPADRYKQQHAQAQAGYRARKKEAAESSKSLPKSDITSDITVTHRGEESRGEKTDKDSVPSERALPHELDADQPDKAPPVKLTDDEIIFGYGVPLLVNAGTAEKQARSFLGSLRKAHGEPALIDCLRACLRAKPLQPLEWLAAALPPKPPSGAAPRRKPTAENFETAAYGAGGPL